jgi:HEAT repeat protein
MAIIAQAMQQRTRRVLLRTLVEMCEGNPERLAPWLSDPRWYVVRNAVHVIGASGGRVPAGMFTMLLTHPEVRVRQEVVAALANCAPDDAQPLLLQLVHDPEGSVRGPALFRLGARRNDDVSRALRALAADPGLRRRPEDEFRSVFSALGGCSTDEALPALEVLLYEFGGPRDASPAYLQSIARAIARIGTPAARTVLDCATRSRNVAARDACRLVLKGTGRV